MVARSGLEQKRDYLGMSQIARCPRLLYRMLTEGRAEEELDAQQHWYCWIGYLWEKAVVGLLWDEAVENLLNPDIPAQVSVMSQNVEVVAIFDQRYRGHVDFEMDVDHGVMALVEIKSVYWGKWNRIRAQGRPELEHVAQVQAYMQHGYWNRAFIVYVARDVPHKAWAGPPFWVYEVEYVRTIGKALDAKARRILAAFDRGVAPACKCGKCR